MKKYEFSWIKVNDHCWHCLDNCTDIIVGSVNSDPFKLNELWIWEVRLPFPMCVSNAFPAGKAKTFDGAKNIVCAVYKQTFEEEAVKK